MKYYLVLFLLLILNLNADKETSLMWQMDIDKQRYSWNEAKSYCSALILNDYDDWTLPTTGVNPMIIMFAV